MSQRSFAWVVRSRSSSVRIRAIRGLILGAAAMAASRAAVGDTLIQWTFDDDTTNPIAGSIPGAISATGGVSTTYAGGLPGRGFQTSTYSAAAANKTAGIVFSIDTSGKAVDSFAFDWRTSNTSSRYLQVQYSLNGLTWTDATQFASLGGDTWHPAELVDLSAITGASDNPLFKLRIVSAFDPAGSTYVASNPTSTYASTGTWRFDDVTLTGSTLTSAFIPSDLTWDNANVTGAWDSVQTNKPWLKTGNPAAFSQGVATGDRVTFNDPAANTVVNVDAAGLYTSGIIINNSNTLAVQGGALRGPAALTKTGAGRLILASSNSFQSLSAASSITGGIIETRADNAIGTGPVTIANATWNSTAAAQSSQGAVTLAGPVTFDTATDLTLSGGISGAGNLIKSGSATLAIGGTGSGTGTVTVAAGILRLDSMAAAGGNGSATAPAPAISVSSSALQLAVKGTRISSNLTLTNATLTRLQVGTGLGAGPSNGDSELSSFDGSGNLVGGHITVSGTTTLSNLETRTSDASGASQQNALSIKMPVMVTAGSTLILHATADSPSQVNSLPVGGIGNVATSLRSVAGGSAVGDSVTLFPGASLVMAGAGEKRLGSSSNGKVVIGMGTEASESTIKADTRLYMTDSSDATDSLLVVAGAGNAGLRIEAAMNATYASGGSGILSTTGLFGIAPPDANSAIISPYTIMSPSRYQALSGFATQPTVAADLTTPIVAGGTLTLAANDNVAGGVTGVIDNGPGAPSVIKLGLDNTAASGTLTYQIAPGANSASFANFGGLVLKQTNSAALLTTRLAESIALLGTGATLDTAPTTFDQLGGTFDLNGFSFAVGSAATLTSGTVSTSSSGGTFAAGSLSKTGAGTATFGPGVALTISGPTTIAAGTLQVHGTASLQVVSGAGALNAGNGTSPAVVTVDSVRLGGTLTVANQATVSVRSNGSAGGMSRVGALSLGATGQLDLADNALIIDYSNAADSPADSIRASIVAAYATGAPTHWTSPGLTTSTSDRALGYALATDILSFAGGPEQQWMGQPIDSTSMLVRSTLAGDADLDGSVNLNDLIRLANHYGMDSGASWADGDFSYDGAVNLNDLIFLANHYGSSLGTGSAMGSNSLGADMALAFGSASVPEPGMLSVLAIGLLGLRRCRRTVRAAS